MTHNKIRHLFDPDYPKGGVTLVYSFEEFEPFSNLVKVSYQFAVCSDKDNFCRKTGVAVAKDKPVLGFTCTVQDDIAEKVALHILECVPKLPIHAKEYLYAYLHDKYLREFTNKCNFANSLI